jgi:hypothetical protein
MKEITLVEFNKLPKKGPISGSSLKPGTMYYVHNRRSDSNPVYIGTYVGPVYYYNDNSTSVNYKFDNVKYLVNSSKYRNEPRGVFGSLEQYFEVVVEPTSMDIKHKKTTIKELKSFINEKKAEPHDTTPSISFMGKDYRKVRDKFYNRSRSSSLSSLSSSSAKRSKRKNPSTISSSSKKRSNTSSSSSRRRRRSSRRR